MFNPKINLRPVKLPSTQYSLTSRSYWSRLVRDQQKVSCCLLGVKARSFYSSNEGVPDPPFVLLACGFDLFDSRPRSSTTQETKDIYSSGISQKPKTYISF